MAGRDRNRHGATRTPPAAEHLAWRRFDKALLPHCAPSLTRNARKAAFTKVFNELPGRLNWLTYFLRADAPILKIRIEVL